MAPIGIRHIHEGDGEYARPTGVTQQLFIRRNIIEPVLLLLSAQV